MNSTAFLRHGFSPAPPRLPTTTVASVTRRLPSITFGCNVSSVHLLVEKSNENYNQFRRCNKNNNDVNIRCSTVNPGEPSSQSDNKFPSPNARMALQSLLCFSFKGAEAEAKGISEGKKKALQELLLNQPDKAVKTMKKVYETYIKNPSNHVKYEATLAFIQILIQSGDHKNWIIAVDKFNEIAKMGIDDRPSDATHSLYQAIVYTLLNDIDENAIKDYWRSYIAHISGSEPNITPQ